VADKLKCVISVFDRSFQFLTEFGGRGNGPGNLIVPQALAMDGSDRLYVIQAGNRGVSVFRMLYN
jgi:DNA-binding beta-propeller fold protein YncE